jgi:hypothetical protein
MTDFLQFLTNKTKLFQPVIPIIEKGIKKSETNSIIDLGSGGGGGLLWISEALQKENPDLQIIMTDLYPNLAAFEYTKKQGKNFEYIADPVDARDIPKKLKGLRTQFLSLHHFRPEDAKKILQNAVDTKQNIAIFEGQERSLASIFAMIFSPLTVLFVTPFIKPFSLGRIIFTYLIPLVPIFVLWDGIVSSLRTYSVKEMEDLVNNLENKDQFDWEIRRKKSGPGVNLYLLGTLKNRE